MKRLAVNFINQLKFFVSIPALLWQLIFLFIPLFFIFILSFLNKSLIIDLNAFTSILDYSHLKIIARTFIISLINTYFCLIIAYPVAYFLAFRTNKFKNFWLTFLTLPLWVNFLVQVYAWFFLLDKNGIINNVLMSLGMIAKPLHLINNTFAILIVMLQVYLPFMIMPLYNVLEKFDYQLIEASLDLGATKWQTFCKITFPLSLSGIYLGFFLVFVMSFGEVAIPLLLGGSKDLYVGSLISQYFLSIKDTGRGAAFTLLSSLILSFFLLIFYLFLKKRLNKV